MKKVLTIFVNICLFVITAMPVNAVSIQPYEVLNNNIPDFSDTELSTKSSKSFLPLDDLGRCQKAQAVIGTDLMPKKKRTSIGMIHPSGWHLIRDDDIDGHYLYNRCHLIGYQLCGENANELNLITGTRFLNNQGMLPFENMVADYVKETDNHVAYRVTPVFEEDDLVASGVQMEAESVEDDGAGIEFNIYCYNIQPGYEIDYISGNANKADTAPIVTEEAESEVTTIEDTEKSADYIININTKVFHLPTCSSVARMAEHNKQYYTGTRDTIIQQGYRPCKNCNP